MLGATIGSAAGAVIGSKFGKGSGNKVALAGGALIGALVGGAIGQALDEVDKAKMASATQKALENQRVGQATTWKNPTAATPARCADPHHRPAKCPAVPGISPYGYDWRPQANIGRNRMSTGRRQLGAGAELTEPVAATAAGKLAMARPAAPRVPVKGPSGPRNDVERSGKRGWRGLERIRWTAN